MKTNKLKLGTVAIAAVLMSVVMTSSVPDCPPYSVLFPNPEDCGSYYHCSNGVPILLNCPDGLHFNASLEVCDWPGSANCSDKNKKALAEYISGPKKGHFCCATTDRDLNHCTGYPDC
jgi:hypothetical protein